MNPHRPGGHFASNTSGVSALEFALVLPIMLTLLFGGYVLSELKSIQRKVTITTRAVADLTTDYNTLTDSQVAQVIGASTQIIAPFDATPLQIRLSEITTNSDIIQTPSSATVTWSTGYNKLTCNTPYPLPSGMYRPNVSYILSEINYVYKPAVGYNLIGPFTITDHIIMLPRASQSVNYSGC